MTRSSTHVWFSLLAALSLGCGSDSSETPQGGAGAESCPTGSEGCPCTAGGACDTGLSCRSETCVDLGGSDGSDATGGESGAGKDAGTGKDAGDEGTGGDAAGGDSGNDATGGRAENDATGGQAGSDVTGGQAGNDATGGDGGSAATGDTGGSDSTGGSGVDDGTGGDSGGCTPGGTASCDPSFGQSDACGGDERGTWDLQQACTDTGLVDEVEAACSGATATDHSVASGTLELDGTAYTRDVTVDISIVLNIPEGNACLGAGLVGCGTLGLTLGDTVSGLSASCADDGSNGCDCTFEGTSGGQSAGTYTVDRSTGRLVIDPTGDAITYDYCIEQGILTARETEGQGHEDQVVQVYACQ